MRIYHFHPCKMTTSAVRITFLVAITWVIVYSLYRFYRVPKNYETTEQRYNEKQIISTTTALYPPPRKEENEIKPINPLDITKIPDDLIMPPTNEGNEKETDEEEIEYPEKNLKKKFNEQLDQVAKEKFLEMSNTSDSTQPPIEDNEIDEELEDPDDELKIDFTEELDQITKQHLIKSKQWTAELKKPKDRYEFPKNRMHKGMTEKLLETHANSSIIHERNDSNKSLYDRLGLDTDQSNSWQSVLDENETDFSNNIFNHVNITTVLKENGTVNSAMNNTLLHEMFQTKNSSGLNNHNFGRRLNDGKALSNQSLNRDENSTLSLHTTGHIFSRRQHKSIHPNKKMLRYLRRSPKLKYKIGFLKDKTFYREVTPKTLMHKYKASVLLLHASMFTSSVWVNIGTLQALGELGYHSFAIDLPGYGRSNRTKIPYSNDEIIIYMIELFEHLGLVRPILVTPSRSGDYVMPLIMSHPNFISGFVAISPTHTSKYSRRFYQNLNIPALVVLGKNDETMLNWASLDNLEHLKKRRIFAITNATTECYVDRPATFHKLLFEFLDSVKWVSDSMFHPTVRNVHGFRF